MVMPENGSVPVPIKPRKLPLPVLSAALGMAVSYYGYPFLGSPARGVYVLPGLLLFSALVVCFLWLLHTFSGKKAADGISVLGIFAAAAAAGFSLGVAAGKAVPLPAQTGIPAERVIAVSGILREDPRTLQGGSGLGRLELAGCAGAGGVRASAAGSVTVFFPAESIPRLKEFGRGSEIYSDGVLSESDRGVLFRASSVHVVKAAPVLEQFRTGLRMALLEKFRGRGDSAPLWSGLASALLLGVRDNLDVDLAEGFRNSGCSHILALSGMHLAVISALLAFLLKRPLGTRWASLAGAVFILFYVFVAGSQPSLVRAALMYILGTAALWGFLRTKPIALLAMAFIIQLLFQSGTGVSWSFVLSYLALGGILTLGETLRALFRGRLPGILAGGLSASLGAFIVTSPVVALFFGSLKPAGIAAGLLLAPLCSLFMILALCALASAFLPPPFWFLFDFVLTWFYRLLEFLVTLAGRLPGISVSGPVPVLVVSVGLWLLIFIIEKKDSARRNSVASFG